MTKRRELVDLIVNIQARTDKAVLVQVQDSDGIPGATAWLPLSQIELDDTGARTITVTLPEWLAIEKELI